LSVSGEFIFSQSFGTKYRVELIF